MERTILIFSLFIICFCVITCQAQYSDVRCKCVCPEVTGNVTSQSIYIEIIQNPSECTCENVVDDAILEQQPTFCHLCECRWERRNTTTMKVVVIIIICLISLLFLYMLFLLCLDPLVTRRQQRSYREHTNEEVNLDTGSWHRKSPEHTRSRGAAGGATSRQQLTSRIEHEMSRVRGAQQKWVGQVQEQRRNIYDRHSMLN